eukprot:Awhi_evm1s13622
MIKHHSTQGAKLRFVLENGTSQIGDQYYIVGSAPELGEWDLKNAIPLKCDNYPSWTTEDL